MLAGALAPASGAVTIRVGSQPEFEAAVSTLGRRGGTIVLLPAVYRRTLAVPARAGRPLRIIGASGARVERVLLYRARNVSLGPLTISPLTHDAWIKAYASRRIDLHDLVVSARGTRYSASVRLPYSRRVTIRRSTFTHCGDRSPSWSFCLLPRPTSRHVTVEDNWFHDCYGCDFIHGRFGSDLTIRRNRFERALPCGMNRLRCGHQDLIELFAGKRLRVERNRFGLYAVGGAQLLLADSVDHVVIANNVFAGSDPRVPFSRSRVGLTIGGLRRVPHDVEVVNNTILAGTIHPHGYAGSIALGARYRKLPRRHRPLIANNVIGVLDASRRLCRRSRATFSNVVVRGQGCSSSDRNGPADLDSRGRPTAASALVLDRADRRYAPAADITGRLRALGGRPDIGAYEDFLPYFDRFG